MKKLFLSFAALAAVVSCVEEKGLEPQQPVSGNQLIIKAVTAPATKTVLGDELPAEGISVLWQEDDAITVLLKDGSSGTAYKEFTAAQVDGTNADFTGEFTAADLEYFDTENVTAAYAVYPSASVSDGVITHTLSEEQNGEITSGMNLAYAALDADEVLNGTATSASFNNALALIQITVPADVMYVSLSTGVTGDALVGEATYTYSDGVLTQNISISRKTVTLKDGDAALAAGTYSLLVFPSIKNNTLTLKMEGNDGAVYEKSLNDIKLMASQCYTINLEKLSYVGEVLPASPLGGEFVIPFVTTENYTYDVDVEIEEGDDEDWIVYEETRGFHQDEIVLALETNDSGEERSANVTVTIENVGSKTFVVSQASAFMDFVYTEENPIEWEETFGLFSDSELNNPVDSDPNTNEIEPLTYKNVFRIELSDDFSKGTYLIDGLFVMRHKTNGPVGGKYYANYKDNKLLVFAKDNATQSYYFSDEIIAITYNEQEQTFSCSNTLQFNAFGPMNSDYSADGYIGNYEVHHYEAPDTGEGINVIGTYQESYTLTNCYSNNNLGLKITISDDPSKGDVMITNIFGNVPTGMYATVTENTITTVESAYIENLNGQTAIGSLTLTVGEKDGEVIVTIPDQTLFGWMTLSNYTATKK